MARKRGADWFLVTEIWRQVFADPRSLSARPNMTGESLRQSADNEGGKYGPNASATVDLRLLPASY